MAKARLSMRKIKETLRLTYQCGLSRRQVAHSLKVSRSTVADYLYRAEKAGMTWPLPDDRTDQELEQRLFPPQETVALSTKPLPDFDYIYPELKAHKKFNLTLDLLWREYKEQHPDGYQYSQFCELYRRWRGKLDYCMRQDHRGGEKLFVDYAEGLKLVDAKTGEPIATQLFVAVWGASNYTYAEATLTQQLPDWIGSHVRAFEYFGCVPKALVPDCLKGAVNRACRYEPELNPTYAEMAEHYATCVLPARPARPRDKAKVEAGVLIAQRWILSALRHRMFYNLAELNRAIQELLERQLRQEGGFGCCFCGHPFSYHHIEAYAESHKHDPARMMVVCPNHHHQCTVNALDIQNQHQAKANPFDIMHGFVNGQLLITSRVIAVEAGSNQFIGSGFKFVVDGEPLLRIRPDTEGRLLLSLNLYGPDDSLLMMISENEWIAGHPLAWIFNTRTT